MGTSTSNTKIGAAFLSPDVACSARLLKARYERSGAGTKGFALLVERWDLSAWVMTMRSRLGMVELNCNPVPEIIGTISLRFGRSRVKYRVSIRSCSENEHGNRAMETLRCLL